MLTKKRCDCGQLMEFEEDDVPFINCPSCGKKVADLIDLCPGDSSNAPISKFNDAADSSASQPSRAKGLFVSVGDETKGPYSLKQIKAMYQSGQLTMDALCCREGDKQWQNLVDLEDEIFGANSNPQLAKEPLPERPINVQVNLPRPSKSRGIYIILGLFLGLLGIHNFYAGYNSRGAVQLLLTVFTWWLLLPILFVGLWVLVEICSVTADAQGVAFN